MKSSISVIPVLDIPILESETQLWDELAVALSNIEIQDGDVLVMAHTPFSRVRGLQYRIADVVPSEQANELAAQINKDPRKVEIILQHSKEIVKVGRGVIIARNNADIVCANAGIDESNAGLGFAIAVPADPDALAKEFAEFVRKRFNVEVGVIISDTTGRALRRAAVNIAIGTYGVPAIRSEIGKVDLFGRELRISTVAVADELASAAELVQGQTNEGVPLVIIRGFAFDFSEEGSRKLNRPDEERLFK